MSVHYLSVQSPWPTTTAGAPARTVDQLAPIHARIAACEDADALHDVAERRFGQELEDLGAEVDEDTHWLADHPDLLAQVRAVESAESGDLPAEHVNDLNLRLGMQVVREHLIVCLNRMCDDLGSSAHLEFDGIRWWVTTGGLSGGDSPTECFDDIIDLANSKVCEDPIDGPAFADPAAVAATVAMLDDVAGAVRDALAGVALDADTRAAVDAALDRARADVIPAARTLRRVLTQVTEEISNRR